MADNVHIEGISDTVAHVRANADAKQRGKFTDNADTIILGEQEETAWVMNTDRTVVWALAAYKQINVSTGAESLMNIEFANIYANGTLFQAQKRIHTGDENTYDEFGTDEYNMYVGAVNSFRITSTYVSINDDSNDIDTKFKTTGSANLLFIDAGNDRIGINNAAPDQLLHITASDTITNTVVYPVKVSHLTSGAAAAGFGVGSEYELEDDAGTGRIAGSMEIAWTDPATAAYDADMIFKVARDGSLTEVLRIAQTGVVTVSADGGGSAKLTLDSGDAGYSGYIEQQASDGPMVIQCGTNSSLTISSSSITNRLGDDTGSNTFDIQDSGGSPVFSVNSNGALTTASFIRASTAIYRRYYHLNVSALAPGASGATWVNADANQLAGWNLDSSTEFLEMNTDVHADWDAASDLDIEVTFTVQNDNSGGAVDDIVQLNFLIYYKAAGDTVCKTQTSTHDVTIGACAQWTQFMTEFPINYDEVDNVVEVGDVVSIKLNMVTANTDVADIAVNDASFYYHTTHTGIESGDS